MAAALVQNLGKAVNNTAGQTSTVLSPVSKTVSVGNKIFVGWGGYYDITPSGVTDNLGNTYTRVERVRNTGGQATADLWVADVTTGGSLTTVTVAHASTQYVEIIAAEWSGVGDLSVAGAGGIGTGTSATWVTNKTIPANGMAIGMVANPTNRTASAGASSGSPSTAITVMDQNNNSPGESGSMAYAIAGGSDVTGFSGTTTLSGSSIWAGAGGVFEPASSGATGTAASTFGWSDAATGAEVFTGTAASAFGWTDGATGSEVFTGTASSAFGWSDAATGALVFTGTAASTFGWSDGATGSEGMSGSAATAFGFASAASGLVANPVSGTLASTFGFSSAATGGEGFSGSGASAFGFSTAGTGAEVFSGSLASAFGWSDSASGLMLPSGVLASTFGWSDAATGEASEPVTGVGASAFGWGVAASGQTDIVTTVVYGTVDGAVHGLAINYTTARNGGTVGAAYTTAELTTGQQLSGGAYNLRQYFGDFDTSFIGAGNTVLSAVLELYFTIDDSDTDFVLEARLYDWGGGAITLPDWRPPPLGIYPPVASLNTLGLALATYTPFTNISFQTSINKTGHTRFFLSSDRLRNGIAPTGDEFVTFESYNGTNKPKLTIVYQIIESFGSGGSTFGWSTSGVGSESVSGAGGSTFGWGVAGTDCVSPFQEDTFDPGAFTQCSGGVSVSGPVGSAFGFSSAATGVVSAVGVLASAFGFSSAATGLVQQGVTGVTASGFGWSSAASGHHSISGVLASAFGWGSSGLGSMPTTGYLASAFGWGTSGVGVMPAAASGGSTFGWAVIASGAAGAVGSGGSTFGWAVGSSGQGGLPFGGSALDPYPYRKPRYPWNRVGLRRR